MEEEPIIIEEPVKQVTIVEGDYKEGDRVKVTWKDVDETEYTSYGVVTKIDEDGNYIVAIERDVDGTTAGSLVVATKVQPVEEVVKTGGIENMPGREGKQYAVNEKMPNMIPQGTYQPGMTKPYYPVQTVRRRRLQTIQKQYNNPGMNLY